MSRRKHSGWSCSHSVQEEVLWLELLPALCGVRERGEEGPFKAVTELGHTNSCF